MNTPNSLKTTENNDSTDLSNKAANNSRRNRILSYLKKLGIAGLAFFLLKGLAWLVLFFFVKHQIG